MIKLLANIFGKKDKEKKTGGMEDYMTLIRVYFQASIASQLGINNLRMLPDLRTFKTTLHVPTVNNKLGVGEMKCCKTMLKDIYQTDDNFCKEIEQSIRKNCRRMENVQPFLLQFQGLTQELMMLVGNLMKFKLRIPSSFKRTLYTATEKTVQNIFCKNDFTDASVMKSVITIRQYNKRLGFSQKWITDFAYQLIMLAKKESKPKDDAKR